MNTLKFNNCLNTFLLFFLLSSVRQFTGFPCSKRSENFYIIETKLELEEGESKRLLKVK